MTDVDTLDDRRQLNPSADLVGIELVEHEGFALELPDSAVGAEYMWNDGPITAPLDPLTLLPIPPAVAVDTAEYVDARRVCNRWIYAVSRHGGGPDPMSGESEFYPPPRLEFRYELRADEYGRLRWLDADAFRALRKLDPGVDDEDDEVYLERGFSGEGGKTLWLSTIAVANSSVAWHFFGVAQRLPQAAVDDLVASYDLWSPDRGLAAWQLDPMVGPPSEQDPHGPRRIGRVFDPVVETRRCSEEYIDRRDRYLEYATPMQESEYFKTSTNRHIVSRIANACRALLEQDPDLDASDVVSSHSLTWNSVADLCFTPFEQRMVDPVAQGTHGVDGFLQAESMLWVFYWTRAERSATALRLWLASRPWEFVQRWTFDRFERDPEPGHWMLATLARAFSRLDELMTGRQYLAWLTRRVVNENFHDPVPNLELMRMMVMPELSAPGPDPIKMARAMPKAAFDLLVSGHRFMLALPIEELRAHLEPLLPDHVAAEKFGVALERFRMSPDRRLFYNCVGRMVDRIRLVTKVEIGGLFEVVDDMRLVVDVPSGPGAEFHFLRFRLRLDTIGNFADDLLNLENELADSFRTTPAKSWFHKTLQRLTSGHVGGVFAIMDIFINAREVYLACRDADGTPAAAFKSVAAFLRSVYSYGAVKAAVDGGTPTPADQPLSKLHTVGPQDPRWLRRVQGSITRRVGASLVGYMLSSVMLGYALHDALEKREEGTDEELLICTLVLVAEGVSFASAFLTVLHFSRAGAVGTLIGVATAVATIAVQAIQPGEPEIGIRTCIFGREYVGRKPSANHNARPWQACRGDSLVDFEPGGGGRSPVEGLATQLFAMTNLLHNFRMRMKGIDGHPLSLRLELQPGYVPRDARFELRVEFEWVVERRMVPMSFELETVSHVYTFALYPDERSMPVEFRKPSGDANQAIGVTDPGQLLVQRDDENGVGLNLYPLDGYVEPWTGSITVDVKQVDLHERYRLDYEIVGEGDGRRLVVRIDHQEALGFITDLVALELHAAIEVDAGVIDVMRFSESGTGTFVFPLPQSEGELVQDSAVIVPKYNVVLPSQQINVDGAPRSLILQEHAETWPVVPLRTPLSVQLSFEAWLAHDGFRPCVGFALGKAWISNLLSGAKPTEMYMPIRSVRVEYKRNEKLGQERFAHEPSTGDGFAVLPLRRGDNGRFEVDPVHIPHPSDKNAIHSPDQLNYRFAVDLLSTADEAWAGRSELRELEFIPRTHGSPALDAKLAKRKILWRARVEARLVLADGSVRSTMPCNLANNRAVWLEQTLQAAIDWKPDRRFTQGPTMPTPFVKAIDACISPP